MNNLDSIFPLCKKNRFESVGYSRTCFEIYYEEGIQGTFRACIICLLSMLLTCLYYVHIPKVYQFDAPMTKDVKSKMMKRQMTCSSSGDGTAPPLDTNGHGGQ